MLPHLPMYGRVAAVHTSGHSLEAAAILSNSAMELSSVECKKEIATLASEQSPDGLLQVATTQMSCWGSFLILASSSQRLLREVGEMGPAVLHPPPVQVAPLFVILHAAFRGRHDPVCAFTSKWMLSLNVPFVRVERFRLAGNVTFSYI